MDMDATAAVVLLMCMVLPFVAVLGAMAVSGQHRTSEDDEAQADALRKNETGSRP